MTSPPASPLHNDDIAATYPSTAPDGTPCVQVVAHRPGDPLAFDGWAGLVRQLAAHPNIATVHYAAAGPDGRPSLVTDATGSTLAERLTQTGPLAVGEAVTNASLLAQALDSLHQNGIRHGQVAPSTILFDGFGHPQLAGLDATAPGLAPSAITSRFNPLDPQPGPAADVYALAATTYTALGGMLPFAADPHNAALRNQSIMDIPGVPPQVTAVLRAALNPDPNARPSAAHVHAQLSAIELPHVPSAAPPMPAEAVGIAARPVTAGVAAVNQAAASAVPRPTSAAPFPTSGVPAPTSGVPGQFSGGAPAYTPPVSGAPMPGAYGPPTGQFTPQQPWNQPQAKKSNTPLILLGGAGAVVIVIVLVIIGAALLKDGGNTPTPNVPTQSPVAAMDERVKQIDLNNAPVMVLQEPDNLVNGVVGRMKLSSTPVYADVDRDNDLDAAAVIQYPGNADEDADPWEYVQIWLYDKDYDRVTPVKFEGTWQWTCTELPNLEVGSSSSYPNTFEITRADANYCDKGYHSTEVIHVEMLGADPVQNDSGHLSGVINCRSDANSTEWESTDVTGKAEPLFVPDPTSQVVAPIGAYSRMVVYYSKDPDTTVNHGYAYGVIYFNDGKYGCGWVPWNVVV